MWEMMLTNITVPALPTLARTSSLRALPRLAVLPMETLEMLLARAVSSPDPPLVPAVASLPLQVLPDKASVARTSPARRRAGLVDLALSRKSQILPDPRNEFDGFYAVNISV